MEVSNNEAIPKWLVYFMENPKEKWMIWGDHHDLGNLQINKGAAKFHRWPPFWAVEEDALDAVETRKRPDWVRWCCAEALCFLRFCYIVGTPNVVN